MTGADVVNAGPTQIRGYVTLGEPKTAMGRRGVRIDKATVALLRASPITASCFTSPTAVGSTPTPSVTQFLRRGTAYGLPRLTVHGLRHTWATLAIEQGNHPKVVQERLGHSTIAITLGLYSHVSPTLHDEAAERIASLLP